MLMELGGRAVEAQSDYESYSGSSLSSFSQGSNGGLQWLRAPEQSTG